MARWPWKVSKPTIWPRSFMSKAYPSTHCPASAGSLTPLRSQERSPRNTAPWQTPPTETLPDTQPLEADDQADGGVRVVEITAAQRLHVAEIDIHVAALRPVVKDQSRGAWGCRWLQPHGRPD